MNNHPVHPGVARTWLSARLRQTVAEWIEDMLTDLGEWCRASLADLRIVLSLEFMIVTTIILLWYWKTIGVFGH